MSKREEQKELKRKHILEAGLNTFTSQGFTATKLDDVAKDAGVAKGTIYLYFDSKEALFEDVIRECLFPAIDEVEDLIAEFDGSASELLTMQLKHFYSTMGKDKIPQILSLLIGEGARFPKLSEFFFREMISRNQEYMRFIIKKGVESREFRDTNVEEFTQILVAPAIISAIWTVQFGKISPLDLEAFAQTHIDLLLKGLMACNS